MSSLVISTRRTSRITIPPRKARPVTAPVQPTPAPSLLTNLKTLVKKHSKSLVAVGGLIVGGLTYLFGADSAAVQGVIGLLTVLGVYGVPNG